MPYRCSAYNCRGNYDKGPKVSVFKFPKDEHLAKVWKHRILRKDFNPTESSRVCELHFKEEDIIRESEFFDEKTGQIHKFPLKFPKLKPDAVPSTIPGAPQHLQPAITISREGPESKKMRLESEAVKIAIAESLKTKESYDESRKFTNLPELYLCLIKEKLSSFWSLIEKNDVLILLNISHDHPEVQYSVFINEDFKCTAYFKKVLITEIGKFEFPDKITNLDNLLNMLNKIELFSNCNINENDTVKNVLDVLCSLLNKLKEAEVFETNIINFILEQLKCLNVSKNSLRYSPDLIIFCSLLNSISPHCYKFLRNSGNLILPHPETLRRICSSINVNPSDEQTNANFLSYIKKKSECLSEKERIITLMIDEIHLQSHFDYVGGKITGMAFNKPEAATSAYVFMISSLLSCFKNVVHILPVKTLTSEDLHAYIKKIIVGLESMNFNVIVVVSDNNSINRKAMSFFSNPFEIKYKYVHPCDPNRPLYFVIDTVHLLKCIRNNWINQKNCGCCMFYPNFDSLKPFETACFDSLKILQNLESDELVKYAYGLSIKALNPTNLERQNLKLVLQIFSPQVIEGLLLLGQKNKIQHHDSTSEYIKIIYKWWSIVNVKTPCKGIHKLDDFQKPLIEDTEDIKYKFLSQFVSWLDSWKEMNSTTGCLTKETHTALKNSTLALIEVAQYCLKDLNFKYFLLGKIQTDLLEERFGKYRQLSGSQYNISIRQVFENEHKLRLKSILPLSLKSNELGDIQLSLFNDDKDWEAIDSDQSANFESKLTVNSNEILLCKPVMPVLTYIAGYSCHVLLKKINCLICKEVLVSNELLNSDVSNEWIAKFDRGGLKYPHSDIVCVVTFCYAVVKKLLSPDFEKDFLFVKNHRKLATTVILDILANEEIFFDFETCVNGHSESYILKHLVWVCVNILLNNFCKKQNDSLVQKKLKKQKDNCNVSKNRKLKTLQK